MPAEAHPKRHAKSDVNWLHMSCRLAVAISWCPQLPTCQPPTIRHCKHTDCQTKDAEFLHHIGSGFSQNYWNAGGESQTFGEGLRDFCWSSCWDKANIFKWVGVSWIPYVYSKLSLYSKLYFCWIHDSWPNLFCVDDREKMISGLDKFGNGNLGQLPLGLRSPDILHQVTKRSSQGKNLSRADFLKFSVGWKGRFLDVFYLDLLTQGLTLS